jgi:phenylalanyl-tRNA synthetase alpha chain
MMDQKELLKKVSSSNSLEALGSLKGEIFGRKGEMTLALRALGQMDPQERKEKAQSLNSLKEKVLQAFAHREKELEHQEWAEKLAKESLDVTLSSPRELDGRFHPLMQTMAEAVAIFESMGFVVKRGPHIETPFYNFDALNVPQHHPARAEHDTFYVGDQLLRTHTSAVQIRTLREEKPPLRIISPGRVYRADYDRTHTPMFHQIEAMVVEEGITMGHLKFCIESFFHHFFGKPVTLRFRPSFFPFTEPSVEVDLSFSDKGDWLEVLGAGMVHPNVFKNCDLDPQQVQGFALGMGLERLTMIKYGIEDIRQLFINDQRWLDHYGFSCATPGL